MDCGGKAEADWRQRRRTRIVAAAAELFRTRPFQSVQMNEVATQAGMGKATVYRYFPSKEALFLAIANDALGRLDERLAATASERDPLQRLRAMLVILVEVFAGQLASLRLLTSEQASVETRWRQHYREHRRRIVEHLRDVMEAGIESGHFRRFDIEVVPSLVIGMIRGGLMGVPQLPPERLAESVCDMALRGCLAGPAGESVRDRGT